MRAGMDALRNLSARVEGQDPLTGDALRFGLDSRVIIYDILFCAATGHNHRAGLITDDRVMVNRIASTDRRRQTLDGWTPHPQLRIYFEGFKANEKKDAPIRIRSPWRRRGICAVGMGVWATMRRLLEMGRRQIDDG